MVASVSCLAIVSGILLALLTGSKAPILAEAAGIHEFNVLFNEYDEAKCTEAGGTYDSQPERGTCYLSDGQNQRATFGVLEGNDASISTINPQDYGTMGVHFWPVPNSGKAAAVYIQQDGGGGGRLAFQAKVKTDCEMQSGPITVSGARSQWDAGMDFPTVDLRVEAEEGFLTFSGTTSVISTSKSFYQLSVFAQLDKSMLCNKEATFTVVSSESYFAFTAPASGSWRFGFGEDYKCKKGGGCAPALPKNKDGQTRTPPTSSSPPATEDGRSTAAPATEDGRSTETPSSEPGTLNNEEPTTNTEKSTEAAPTTAPQTVADPTTSMSTNEQQQSAAASYYISRKLAVVLAGTSALLPLFGLF